MQLYVMIQLVFQYELRSTGQNGLLLRVAAEAQTPSFEPIELLVPPLAPPDTAIVACFLLKKHTCKVWAGAKGGPVSGRSPRHGLCCDCN